MVEWVLMKMDKIYVKTLLWTETVSSTKILFSLEMVKYIRMKIFKSMESKEI